MNPRILSLCLLAATGLVAGCDGGFERTLTGAPSPTPEPTPASAAAAPASPKPGSWMWDKNRKGALDTKSKKR